MVTMEQFIAYIGGTEEDLEDPRLIKCLEVAEALVLQYVASTCDMEDSDPLSTSSIPSSIIEIAVIKVADEINNQRNMRPSPREQLDYGAGLLSNTGRDPMNAAYNLLRGWVSPW